MAGCLGECSLGEDYRGSDLCPLSFLPLPGGGNNNREWVGAVPVLWAHSVLPKPSHGLGALFFLPIWGWVAKQAWSSLFWALPLSCFSGTTLVHWCWQACRQLNERGAETLDWWCLCSLPWASAQCCPWRCPWAPSPGPSSRDHWSLSLDHLCGLVSLKHCGTRSSLAGLRHS